MKTTDEHTYQTKSLQRKMGRPPLPGKVCVQVVLTRRIVKQMDEIAKEMGISRSALIRLAVDMFLEEQP